MEYKSFEFELKDSTEEGRVTGFASTYGDLDSYRDIVMPGAFTKTLNERKDRIPFLWEHDKPVGDGTATDTAKGLIADSMLFPELSTFGDHMALLRRRVVKSMSIGYKTMKDGWDKAKDARLLHEIKLYEISYVLFPANEQAMIDGVKSDDRHFAALRMLYEFQNEIKAGRAISAATRAKLLSAIETIQSLLADAEADEKSKEPPPHSGDILDVLRDIRKSR